MGEATRTLADLSEMQCSQPNVPVEEVDKLLCIPQGEYYMPETDTAMQTRNQAGNYYNIPGNLNDMDVQHHGNFHDPLLPNVNAETDKLDTDFLRVRDSEAPDNFS